MTAVVTSAALRSAERADLIYAQARSDSASRLWQAALGTDAPAASASPTSTMRPELDLYSLLAVMGLDPTPRAAAAQSVVPQPVAAQPNANAPGQQAPGQKNDDRTTPSLPGLGPNGDHRATIDAAASRTGIPASAIAAIINAEAAKHGDGKWDIASRNARSSARGLGQFLVGTWESEAERGGTWLNAAAKKQGWLDDAGKVLPAARQALMALRGNAEASINAAADYAKQTIASLRRAGVDVGSDVASIAHAAYIGHNLGVGDAIRFLGTGLDNVRAKLLLTAQIGASSASRRIDLAGTPVAAHRNWLLNYVQRNINPNRFGI